MWREVLKVNYLKNKLVDEWIKACKKGSKRISNTWSYCLNSLNAVIYWVAINLGIGSKIRIGEYPIVVTTSFYKMFEDLKRELNNEGITFLCQAISNQGDCIVGEKWK